MLLNVLLEIFKFKMQFSKMKLNNNSFVALYGTKGKPYVSSINRHVMLRVQVGRVEKPVNEKTRHGGPTYLH